MDELRRRECTMKREYDFQAKQFDVKQEAYAKSIKKLKEAKWYNKWYYKQKENEAYLDFLSTAGKMYLSKCLLKCLADEIKEKDNNS